MGGGADVVRRMMRGQAHVKKMAAFLPYTRYGADGDPDALAPNEAGVRCARLNDTADDGGHGASPPLRVFMQEHPNWSWGRRVCGSLRSFAPAGRVCWTDSRSDADVEIVHVDGDNELWYAETVAALRAPPFVVLQHGLTQQNFWQPRPSRQAYAAVWSRALLVVSFQVRSFAIFRLLPASPAFSQLLPPSPTPTRCALLVVSLQDLAADAADGERGFDFYPMPWGANEDVFAPGPNPTPADERAKTVLIFGNLGETPGDDESNGSVLGAAAHAGLRVRHVGDPGDSLCHPCPGGVPAAGETDTGRLLCQPMASLGGKAPCFWHDNLGRISDAEMVAEMRSARFAAVLRKHEGFEMPGIESLFCGARAIVYDLPSYRWYEGHASFLNASLAGEEHAAELRAMLERPPRPVAETELAELRRAFAWQSIVPQLFERIRTQLAAKVPISSVRGVPVPLG